MEKNLKNEIYNLLKNQKASLLNLDEITNKLSSNKTEVKKMLDELVDDYKINKSNNNKYGLLQAFNLYIGTIDVKRQGYGFFKSEELIEEVFIPKNDMNSAMNGDTVLTYVISNKTKDQKDEGTVKQIIKRNDATIVGKISLNAQGDKIILSDEYTGYAIAKNYGIAVIDDVVKANIIDFDEREKCYICEIVKIIGNINDIGIDIESIVSKYNFDTDFSEKVIEEVKHTSDNFNADDLDLEMVDELIITIDGADAKDLDDAVSVKRLKNGNFKLGVYIADVSYFVRQGTALDDEALSRGTSVYLTDRVIPMLPHKLSNDLCSLNPDTVKLIMGCEMEINRQGSIISSRVFEGKIKSNFRMTYNNVNKIIDCIKQNKPLDTDLKKYEKLIPMTKDMMELSDILHAMRRAKGSLEFEIPESKIIVDKNGKPIDVVLIDRGISERIIEQFMLIANETVAYTVTNLKLPFIYRVHDEPNSVKLIKFKAILKNTKYTINSKSKNITPKSLQVLLEQIGSEDPGLNTSLLRLMSKAIYSENNIGHYALASKCYTHFTSPIRRYPDLLVHRLLKKYIVNSKEFYETINDSKLTELETYIAKVAVLSSEQEQKAISCEYDVADMKKAEYMEDHIGEIYTGKISSVTNFGMFVVLDNGIEGLVHIKNMKDDYYVYREDMMALYGRRTKNIYRLGNAVKIKVVGANKDAKQIDFNVVMPKKTGVKHESRRKKYQSRRKK